MAVTFKRAGVPDDAGKPIRDGFDSSIYSKPVNEHQYILCTEVRPKYEQQHTSFAAMTAIRVVEGD